MKEIIESNEGWTKGQIGIVDKKDFNVLEKFPAGYYHVNCQSSMFGIAISYVPYNPIEKYIESKSEIIREGKEIIDRFFHPAVKTKYAELGITYKTSILFHGPTGTGKTVSTHIVVQHAIKNHDAIALIIQRGTRTEYLEKVFSDIAAIDRHVILFIDECDDMLDDQETFWLTVLDGSRSIPNSIFIGCTNNKHRIPARLLRPSRIEHKIYVGTIDEDVALEYLNEKIKSWDKNLKYGIVHEAIEDKVSMDVFKNTIKELYIYDEEPTIEKFKVLLKKYNPSKAEVAAEREN